VVTPGPRKQRREVATIEVEALSERDVSPEAAPVEAEELDADSLDFREVGIRTWKIRATIGLTYDFSDLSTLKRYIAQGKVGDDDQLSFDGSTWTRLGDIEDLDGHFIAVWKQARASAPDEAASIAQPTPPVEPARPTWPEPPGARTTSSRSTPARRTGARAAAPAPRRKDYNKQILWATAALSVVAGCLLALSHTRPMPVEPPDEVADEVAPEGTPSDALAGADSLTSDAAPTAAPVQTPAPVVAATPSAPGRLAPPSQWGNKPTPTPVEGSTVAGDNWFRGGLRAMQEDDYGKARDMFARAVKKAPAEPRYWEALAEAQVVLGDTEGAAVSYSKVEELGHANVGR
jgi:TolA-binding protein